MTMAKDSIEKDQANVDAAEIAKFEAMAPIWWDKDGDFKALHDINALRLEYINTHTPLAGRRVLDVGCGDGFHLDLLRRYGESTWTLEGIDSDDRAVAAARRRGLHRRGEAVAGDQGRRLVADAASAGCYPRFTTRL